MNNDIGTQYILNGASQYGFQWDGSAFDIQSTETITRIKKRLFRNDLFQVESDGRIVEIHKSIVNRYFKEVEE